MFFLLPANGCMLMDRNVTGTSTPIRVLAHDTTSSWLELALYLGKDFDPGMLATGDGGVLAEASRYATMAEFYAKSQSYLYHLTSYFLEGWKRPGYAWLMLATMPGQHKTVLDYGCGIGSDGLWFLEQNLNVDFADMDSPSRRYLAWRLARRYGHHAQIYDLDAAIPHHDVVWCMDVLEHLPPDDQWALIEKLPTLADTVIMNMVDDKNADGRVHYPVDVEGFTHALEEGPFLSKTLDCYPKDDGSRVRFLAYGLILGTATTMTATPQENTSGH